MNPPPYRANEEVRVEWDEVARAASGDLDAFHDLYRRHLPRIARLARWLLNTTDVDDSVQEVFVRAWRKLGSFDRRAAFGTWLDRLAVNVLLRHRKRRRRREGVEGDLPREPAGAAASPHLRLDLEEAVATLPERARLVFVLYDVHGWRHLEIADRLQISPLTSRSQLHRARMLLRAHLSPEEA